MFISLILHCISEYIFHCVLIPSFLYLCLFLWFFTASVNIFSIVCSSSLQYLCLFLRYCDAQVSKFSIFAWVIDIPLCILMDVTECSTYRLWLWWDTATKAHHEICHHWGAWQGGHWDRRGKRTTEKTTTTKSVEKSTRVMAVGWGEYVLFGGKEIVAANAQLKQNNNKSVNTSMRMTPVVLIRE